MGLAALALTVTASLTAMKHFDWTIHKTSFHAKFGFAVFVISIALILGGLAAFISNLKVNAPWNSSKILLIGKVHKYFGWCVILVAQVAVGTGINSFCVFNGWTNTGYVLIGASSALFTIALIVYEILHQLKLRKEVKYIVPETSMSKTEFDQAISKG